MSQGFLPVTRQEMLDRGWEQVDFVYVCGDAYVDHSSFGAGDHYPCSGGTRLPGWNDRTAGLEG